MSKEERKYVVTLSELKRIKQEARDRAIEEIQARYMDILKATADDDQYLCHVTMVTAMLEKGYTAAEIYELLDLNADIQVDLNEGRRDLKKMDKNIYKTIGLQLKKEE